MIFVFAILNKMGLLLVILGIQLTNTSTTKFTKILGQIGMYFGILLFLLPENVIIVEIPFGGLNL